MQASVHTFDSGSGTGSVLCDDGRVLPFEETAWAQSGLLHLRVGQRICLRMAWHDDIPAGEKSDEGAPRRIAALWINGIGDGQEIT